MICFVFGFVCGWVFVQILHEICARPVISVKAMQRYWEWAMRLSLDEKRKECDGDK